VRPHEDEPSDIMFAIEINNLKKSYGDVEVLKGINLKIKEGEIFALLGPNGAGKTTLMRIIAEGLRYNEGEIKIFGKDLSKEVLTLIGYSPQENISYDLLTVEENLKFYADLYNIPYKRIEELINIFKLPKDKKAKDLSGGYKKRLNLAISLIHNPKILILDEPSTGLDVSSRKELWSLLKELKDMGKTIILSTHHIEEAEEIIDRAAIMNSGKIIAVGSVKELKKSIGVKNVIEVEGILNGLDKLDFEIVVKDNTAKIYVEDVNESLPKIVETLTRHNSKIKYLYIKEITLEDAFLKIVGECNEN
jgi:ABC-2 type transport system ATP-binding protein